MPGTDALDDASADHELFEAELVAQDQDAARVAVADIDDGKAHSLVNDDVVTPIPDERILVHEPSDEAFDSILQLAVFHRGWTVARDTDGGGFERGTFSELSSSFWDCVKTNLY